MRVFALNDKVKVTNINYGHQNRVQRPLPLIIGLTGTIIKISALDNDAYTVKLNNGSLVLLYTDELEQA